MSTPDSPTLPDTKPTQPVLRNAGLSTDKGPREKNEDSLGAAALRRDGWEGDLYVVSDGMGGHDSGEVASRLAVQTVLQALTAAVEDASKPVDLEAWLRDAIEQANTAVRARAAELKSSMGCTLVVAVSSNGGLRIASVGDSRAYRLGLEGLEQITHDQSFVQTLVDAGAIQADQAKSHPYANVLTQAIGQNEGVTPDLFEVQLAEGEQLLMCTDGLWKPLGEEQLAEIARSGATPQAASQALVDAANASGGDDNVSVILLRPAPAA